MGLIHLVHANRSSKFVCCIYSIISHILLANIHPDLQFSIISQNKNPNSLIVVDTMNLWIETTPTQLKKVLSASNIFLFPTKVLK